MSVIMFDMNNLALRCIHSKDVKIVDEKTKKITQIDWEYWRLIVFNSIYMSLHKVKNAKTIVLAVDSRNSWRYEIWSRYKEDRRKKKGKDDFPWDNFFEKYEELVTDFKEHLPFKIIKVDRAEGDDIIGSIALNVPDIFEIISTDGDFLQLVKDNVRLYNPIKQTHLECPDTGFYLVEQCFLGQAKDSIFNIKTPDDWPEGKRKPGFGPKAFEKAIEYGWQQYIQDNNLEHNFKRNLNLIDLKRTPEDIKDNILDEYNNYKYPHPENIWKLIKKYGWPDIIESFTQVENNLLQLY